ncbi:hypothetical protein [Mycobacterium sp.]|uniref:hypothetical protein n=1 Tax=Mycobacterium sp. TaxID=1785 RepID=UPI003BB06AC1
MAAPASPLQQLERPIPLPRASSPRSDLDDFGRYRFQVVAADIADAVMSIGGLIFDRAMAGWDVSVVVDGGSDRLIDDRPIRILGGSVATRLESLVRPPARPHMLAIATDVMVKSAAVRRQVLAAGNDKEAEVLLWGRHHPTNLNCRFVAGRHRPSAAAHVFKSQALAAAGELVGLQADEGFYSLA